MAYETVTLVKNENKGRFEIAIEGYAAFILYEMLPGDVINLYHTEVAEELEGKGVANALALKTLEYCQAHKLKVLPSCPFLVRYIIRHPEWQSIVVSQKGYENI